MKIQFGLERDTKNTYRFQELGEDGEPAERDDQMVGTIYVKKSFFENGVKAEDGITVELTATGAAPARKPAAKK